MLKIELEKKDLDRALNAYPKGIEKQLYQAVRDTLKEVRRTAKELVPVRTGDLRGSIGFRSSRKDMSGFVFASMPYALFVEEGTSRMEAQPYLRPALEQHEPYLGERTQELMDDLANEFNR